ncbi:hypothetical protein FoTM2_013251 [Fusarium oxysporum f. sp. vasinfectum]|uniref:Uncharacterized protein n=1 Tax=Fusarium oxysporum f. sp. vasinfectum 25433 TaxID=1089449 RepID=X0L219_FUSOX|nr:hypothetical protein FOTG_16624 [Fusarium oxysporum f. sp. vasinfectum 25433]KAK2926385.1 hypothetical protein FoTM2_013251 [Fusarium oxysporum f. sp. vasinfectum]
MSTLDDLRAQWVNPGDVLSLLLLIGGDIVQKAIAQLIGCEIHIPTRRHPGLSIAPVAFSFGWVAFGFSNLLSAIGERRLMPAAEYSSIVVNCSNGFARETRSWVLSRILRDHEMKFEVDSRSKEEGGRAESLRVDIFTLGPAKGPTFDALWWFGWITILAQICIAIIPWIFYGDWGVMIVALCGNLIAAVTCALPQWKQEKWAGRKLDKDKVTCLTRGNGSLHVMVFIGSQGSWDLESLAAGTCVPRPETRWISLALATLWTCLLITVSGMKRHTWFLVGIGGIGMLQNVIVAGVSREPSAFGFHITRFARAPTIIGIRRRYDDDGDAHVDVGEVINTLADLNSWATEKPKKTARQPPPSDSIMPSWLSSMSRDDGVPEWLEAINPTVVEDASRKTVSSRFPFTKEKPSPTIYAIGVHGALMELEKWVPTGGLAMIQVFFPTGLSYSDQSIRDNVHKKFWKRAYHTQNIRKRAEEKRRAEERQRKTPTVDEEKGKETGPI